MRTSNLHGIRHKVWEEWKIAAADDHNGGNYRYDNERDESISGFHNDRWFDSRAINYQA